MAGMEVDRPEDERRLPLVIGWFVDDVSGDGLEVATTLCFPLVACVCCTVARVWRLSA